MAKVLSLSERLDSVALKAPSMEATCLAIAKYLNALAHLHHITQALELVEAVLASAGSSTPGFEATEARLAALRAAHVLALTQTSAARAGIEAA